jgi:hypothetical protein
VQVREVSCNCSLRYSSTSVTFTSGENRETKRDFLRTGFCTTERDEELLTPNIGVLVFLAAPFIAVGFAGEGLAHFFLATAVKPSALGFSTVPMVDSGSKLPVETVTAAGL